MRRIDDRGDGGSDAASVAGRPLGRARPLPAGACHVPAVRSRARRHTSRGDTSRGPGALCPAPARPVAWCGQSQRVWHPRDTAASTIAAAHSRSPPPRAESFSTTRRSRAHRSARVHAMKRRWAVAGETAKENGRRCQAHSLVRTKTTAANTSRSSSGSLPPPCGRRGNPGISGAVSPHKALGTKRCERDSPMTVNHGTGHEFGNKPHRLMRSTNTPRTRAGRASAR